MHIGRRRLFATAFLFGTCVAPQLGAQRSAPVTLENRAIRIRLDARDGQLMELFDKSNRKSFIGGARDSVGLWQLHLRIGTDTTTLGAARARRFRSSRIASGLQLVWDQFGVASAPSLRVVATVKLQGQKPLSEWRLQLEGIAGLAVDSVGFPRITGIASVGPAEELAVATWMGGLAREPRRLLAGPDGQGRRLEWFYPGRLSLQALALYQDAGPGLYAAANDSLDYRKTFALWGDASGAAGYEMMHLLQDPGKHARYAMPYSAVVGTFTGDWFTAAEIYREWGTRQRWARESRLAKGEVPEWVTNTALWIWNRGRSPGVLEPGAAIQKELGLPVSVFWHWWHKGAYDTSFPDYLPPREGAETFKAAVKTAHDQGLHAIVYMNQRLWCLDTPSWTAEKGERAAVRKSDGTIRTEVYNIFNPLPCATMDVTQQQWRDKYAGIGQEVLRDYGIDGIYMDQAVLSLPCYAPDHGHPIGGGNYWLEGFNELARDLRRRNAGQPTTLAGEGGGENWLPELDVFLTLQVSQERYAEPTGGWEVIPFFQSVYHAYGISYGSYSSLSHPPYDDLWPTDQRPATALQPLDRKYRHQFYLEQARSFVWGMQPTIANFLPWQLTERPQEMRYALDLARLRNRFPEYLLRGTFLRAPELNAPEIDVTISRLSIYAGRDRGRVTEYVKKAPAAIAGAWRSPAGRVAVNVASIVEEPQTLAVRIDPAAYGLRNGGRVIRVDGPTRTTIGELGRTVTSVSLELGPLGAAMLELEPR